MADKVIPKPAYPEHLPITQYREEIIDAIRQHQVIILSGETGSGKTTQIPRMCIEARRAVHGLIACTQPRRIAALTVAERIGEELGSKNLVGCRIRFHSSCQPENIVRIMTDGILLAENQNNPSLSHYNTIIIDEAHERSLNIDVLLGMTRRLIDRRKDLKLIITSATLDTEKFSEHFKQAPIIEVSGRTFPVEILYKPPDSKTSLSLTERITAAVQDVLNSSRSGDILVFLPTEQDIRDTMDLVRREYPDRLNILSLFARMPASEQRKVFETGGKRKLVIATNIAETSLTIPGIRYVIDSGIARISRYNPGTGTHGLPVDPISRASADQRAGRCGRVENGTCIRLYSEEDYLARPRYTLPEIKRTNLADVILRLIDLGITDIENFPFVDPPSTAGIKDGLRTLMEVGALVSTKDKSLTPDGKMMAQLPIDPRFARMLIQADRENCLGDILPIVAALSLQDPREVSPEKAAQAESAHAVFKNEHSDFITWLNIWDGFRTQSGKGGFSARLKRYCREHYLSFRRMREWMDVHRQLALMMEENGYRPNRRKPEPWVDKKGGYTQRYSSIHRSIISGLLSHLARLANDGSYEATRNRKVYIHPGSGTRKTSAMWIVASEVVRTSRLFARSVAAVDPLWLEELGKHLLTKKWINPHWNNKTGSVMAEEQSRLFGFLVSDGKMVPFGPVNPREAREIFINSFLINAGRDSRDYEFLKKNRRLIRNLESVESKLRRNDYMAGEDAQLVFYDQRLPAEVLDVSTLNTALKTDGNLEFILCMEEKDLLTGIDVQEKLQQYPDEVQLSGKKWRLTYNFNPGSKNDGVTLKIPSGRLADIEHGSIDWKVPGLLREKIEAMLRSLPKHIRRQLFPIAETAEKAFKSMPQVENLQYALSSWLYKEYGVDIPHTMWEMDKLPDYLKVRFSLLNDAGREVASGYNPMKLESVSQNSQQKNAASQSPSREYRRKFERSGLKDWPEDLPESVNIGRNSLLWPALKDDGESVSLRFYDFKSLAEKEQIKGQQRLASIYWKKEIKSFREQLFLEDKARQTALSQGGASQMEDRIWQRVVIDVFAFKIVRKKKEWVSVLLSGGKQLYSTAIDYFKTISLILTTCHEVEEYLRKLSRKGYRQDFLKLCMKDARAMISGRFIEDGMLKEWHAMPRWLKAVEVRARRGVENPAREKRFQDSWSPLRSHFKEIAANLSEMASSEKKDAVAEAGYMMKELELTLSANGEIRPLIRISGSKMKKFLEEIERMI